MTQTQEKSMLPYKACHFPCPHQSRASRPGYAWILDAPGRGEMFLILLLLYGGSFHLKSLDFSLCLSLSLYDPTGFRVDIHTSQLSNFRVSAGSAGSVHRFIHRLLALTFSAAEVKKRKA